MPKAGTAKVEELSVFWRGAMFEMNGCLVTDASDEKFIESDSSKYGFAPFFRS